MDGIKIAIINNNKALLSECLYIYFFFFITQQCDVNRQTRELTSRCSYMMWD